MFVFFLFIPVVFCFVFCFVSSCFFLSFFLCFLVLFFGFGFGLFVGILFDLFLSPYCFFFSLTLAYLDEMIETIGQGTFGKVVKCLDLTLGRYVAIKIVRAISKYSESAEIEIDILSKIQMRDPTGSK